MKIKRLSIIKGIVVCGAVLLTLFLFDAFMNTGKDVDNKNIFKCYNDSINNANYEFSKKNPYGFTDYVYKKQKPDSVTRLAIIGDSFIWGDGLPFEKVWSHKTRKKLSSIYKNVETLSWGKNGWSTLDAYNFFVETGYQYNINLLIFGFVTNDPDMGDYKHMDPLWYKRLGFMYKVFPRLTGTVLDNLYNSSYAHWMKKLYTQENLNKYKILLENIKKLEKQHNLNVLFVLTPNSIHHENEILFPQIINLLNEVNIDYVYLVPAMDSTFANVSPDELFANPANKHPGDKLTEFFADEVCNYILENKYIKTVNTKKNE